MILRVALLGLIACGLAGFGTIVWMVTPHGETAAAAQQAVPVQKLKVVVAAKALKPGNLLKNEDMAVREIDEDKLPDGYIVEDNGVRRGLVGAMARRALAVGDVVASLDLLKPGDHGFLSAVLRPGYRAVTVAVDSVSGSAGLIWPGDRVDLILTQNIDDQAAVPGRKIAAETVLRDVRVIAIDADLVQGTPGLVAAIPVRTITLEVSSANAEQVQVATRLGKLSLAVRSAEHGPSEDRDGTTWAGDVSSALGNSSLRPQVNTMKIFTGAAESKEFKF